MTQPPSADQFLAGGAKSASFRNKPIGHSYTGVICDEPKVTQQTNPDDGTPEFWPSGDPKWQLVIKIQTDLRDDADDDGIRGVYIKGKSLTEAVKKATAAAGVKTLKQGGVFTVTYVGDGPQPSNKVHNPPKLYTVSYVPPPDRAQEAFFSDGSPVPTTPPGMASTHQANTAAALAASVPAPPAGVDPAVWASMLATQRATLAAALGAPGAPAASVVDAAPPF